MKPISFIHLVNVLFIMLLLCGCTSLEVDYNCGNSTVATVEKSREFNSYKEECVNLASHMTKIIKRTNSSDAKKIVELYQLYQVHPKRYKELLEYQIRHVVGQDSTFYIKKVAEVYKEKRKILKYLDANKVNDNDRIYISSKLIKSMYSKTSRNELSVSKVMTRSETDSPCERACGIDRDSDLDYAKDLVACATVINTATCVLTLGGSALGWWVAEFGIAFAYDAAVRKAWDDYERCISRCE